MFSIVKVAREQTQPGSLLSRLGGKMRDPGNEVGKMRDGAAEIREDLPGHIK